LFVLKKISDIEYSKKDKLFLDKHKKLQSLIKKDVISIEYCEKQTIYLKEIAKQLGIDLSSIRVCKIINGVKRCGLKRVFKRKGILHRKNFNFHHHYLQKKIRINWKY